MHLIADYRRAEIEIHNLNARIAASNQEKKYFESQVSELQRKIRKLENEQRVMQSRSEIMHKQS